jgi:uncharacterized protein
MATGGKGEARRSPGIAAALLLALIGGYQRFLSPFFGRQCRFVPTCSVYTREAVEQHGAARGTWLGLHRVLRCQPLCAHGYDPVPARFSWRGSRPQGHS